MKLITLITVMPLMTLMAQKHQSEKKEEVTDDYEFPYAAVAHTSAFLLLCGSSESGSSRVQRDATPLDETGETNGQCTSPQ
jgi:hypothetical protein